MRDLPWATNNKSFHQGPSSTPPARKKGLHQANIAMQHWLWASVPMHATIAKPLVVAVWEERHIGAPNQDSFLTKALPVWPANRQQPSDPPKRVDAIAICMQGPKQAQRASMQHPTPIPMQDTDSYCSSFPAYPWRRHATTLQPAPHVISSSAVPALPRPHRSRRTLLLTATGDLTAHRPASLRPQPRRPRGNCGSATFLPSDIASDSD